MSETVIEMPSRDLDALVAERVFGFHREVAPKDYDGEHGGNDVLVPPGATLATLESALPRRGDIPLWFFAPTYSSDIRTAWLVVERLGRMGLYVTISKPPDAATWDVRGWEPEKNRLRYIAHGGTAPLAICLAALDAMEERKRTAPQEQARDAGRMTPHEPKGATDAAE